MLPNESVFILGTLASLLASGIIVGDILHCAQYLIKAFNRVMCIVALVDVDFGPIKIYLLFFFVRRFRRGPSLSILRLENSSSVCTGKDLPGQSALERFWSSVDRG